MSEINTGDTVKATKQYLDEVCTSEERARAEHEGGLFGTVVKPAMSGPGVYRVRWDAPGFSPDFDVVFDGEIEKVVG